MTRFRLFFLLSIFTCFSFVIEAQKINGVSFVASGEGVRSKHIQPVVDINANYVALMPFGFISSSNKSKIHFNTQGQWFGERKEGIIQYSQEFKKKGIKVMLKPQLWIRGKFTGHMEMNSEEEWIQLQNSYQKFILFYARLATTINAEIFCIGTELEKFVMSRPQFWDELVLKIRKLYKGKLTYAANWDEYSRVHLWNDLDYIGVDAYFPVSDKKSPTVKDFEDGWKVHKLQMKSIQRKFNKPFLFTEFGYRSVNYTGKQPWDSSYQLGDVNFTAQSNGLQAIYNQFWNEKWFAGGFVWKWFLQHEKVGGLKNNRFTPQNKPAELLLKKLYKQ